MSANEKRVLSRRHFLRFATVGAGAVLAACQPQIVEVTKIVEKEKIVEKPVEKVVKETVVVEKQVEKVVEKTVVVQKEVVKEVAKSAPVVRWVWQLPTSGMDDLLKALNEFQNEKGIRVQFEPNPGDWNAISQKILAEFAAGNAPDLWINYGPYARLCIDKQIAMPYNDFIDKENYDLSDYVKGQLDAGTKGGKMYGLPNYCGIWGLWYNKDLFDEAGIAVPDKNTWDIDKYLSAAQKLTKRDAKGFMTQAGTEPAQSLEFGLSAAIWSYGGEVADPNDLHICRMSEPLALEALQMEQDIKWKYKVVPSAAESAANNTAGGWGTFPSGKSAMREDGAWFFCCNMDAVKDKFVYGVAPHWKGPGAQGRRLTFLTTDLWLASSKAKYPDAVWEFVKWCAGPVFGQFHITWEHLQPSRKSLAPLWEKAVKEFAVSKNPKMENLDVSPFIEGYNYARPMFYWECHTDAMEILNPVLDQIYATGKGSVQKLIPEVCAKISKIAC